MIRRLAVLLAVLAWAPAAQAETLTLDLGHLDLTGTFTVTACCGTGFQLFHGWFSPLSAVEATGLFAPYVHAGDPLLMPSPIFVEDDPPYLPWTLSGFTVRTTWAFAAGSDAATWVSGGGEVLGHGMDIVGDTPTATGGTYGVSWAFLAPSFTVVPFQPVTGPIQLHLAVGRIEHVAARDSTAALLGLGLVGLLGVARLVRPAE